MTSFEPARDRWLGVAWLALAIPAGLVAALLTAMSDHTSERWFGGVVVLLAVASVAAGLLLIDRGRRALRLVSLSLSALWLVAAVVVAVNATFAADAALGGISLGTVGVATGLLAWPRRVGRSQPAQSS